jgi:hypothetical protein
MSAASDKQTIQSLRDLADVLEAKLRAGEICDVKIVVEVTKVGRIIGGIGGRVAVFEEAPPKS